MSYEGQTEAKRLKPGEEVSPASSPLSMKSEQSMDPPGNFRGGGSPFMPSPLSMKSEQSMDPPGNFRGGDSPFMPSALLTEDHLRCTAGHCDCPQGPQSYSSDPALYTNSSSFSSSSKLSSSKLNKLQQFSPVPPTPLAYPGDVACDFCTGRKLRAVKSCLTCGTSFCEFHGRHHYTVTALQRHTLVEPTYTGGHQDQNVPEQWNCGTAVDVKLHNDQSHEDMLEKQVKVMHDMNDLVAATSQNCGDKWGIRAFCQEHLGAFQELWQLLQKLEQWQELQEQHCQKRQELVTLWQEQEQEQLEKLQKLLQQLQKQQGQGQKMQEWLKQKLPKLQIMLQKPQGQQNQWEGLQE